MLREQLVAFMEAQVYPNERALAAEDDAAEALMRELQGNAKAAGLWAMFIGPDAGGDELGFRFDTSTSQQVIGRSLLVAPRIFGCRAPEHRLTRSSLESSARARAESAASCAHSSR